MNAPPALPSGGAAPPRTRALPTARAALPPRTGAAGSDFKVLRTNRVPQQLSLFERPRAGR